MFHLMIEYHVPSNQERHEEYLACLQENLNNPLIDKIHIFLESDRKRPPIDDPKIVYTKAHKKSFKEQKGATLSGPDKSCLKIGERGRALFSDYFRYARENLHGKSCIIANSDIFFDETLEVINDIDLGNTLICLSRWDIKKGLGGDAVKLYNRADSQDSWIFTSPMDKKVEEEASFFLGRVGCDNRLAWIAHEAGMKLTNPAQQIITKHLHMVDYRTYVPSDTLLENDGTGMGRWADFMKVHITNDWELSRVGNVADFYTESR
jgi:hypothetical protein